MATSADDADAAELLARAALVAELERLVPPVPARSAPPEVIDTVLGRRARRRAMASGLSVAALLLAVAGLVGVHAFSGGPDAGAVQTGLPGAPVPTTVPSSAAASIATKAWLDALLAVAATLALAACTAWVFSLVVGRPRARRVRLDRTAPALTSRPGTLLDAAALAAITVGTVVSLVIATTGTTFAWVTRPLPTAMTVALLGVSAVGVVLSVVLGLAPGRRRDGAEPMISASVLRLAVWSGAALVAPLVIGFGTVALQRATGSGATGWPHLGRGQVVVIVVAAVGGWVSSALLRRTSSGSAEGAGRFRATDLALPAGLTFGLAHAQLVIILLQLPETARPQPGVTDLQRLAVVTGVVALVALAGALPRGRKALALNGSADQRSRAVRVVARWCTAVAVLAGTIAGTLVSAALFQLLAGTGRYPEGATTPGDLLPVAAALAAAAVVLAWLPIAVARRPAGRESEHDDPIPGAGDSHG